MTAEEGDVEAIVVYGAFSCPWSYLASRRAAVLAGSGMVVDWRAVEHEVRQASPPAATAVRLGGLKQALEQVRAELLPGEQLPYSLPGFVPATQAAVSAYAEAHVAKVPVRARRLLFEGFWRHGLDIGDPAVVRTLMRDAVRSGSSPSQVVSEWGYAVDVTGGPLTTAAWRLIAAWDREWRRLDAQALPILLGAHEAPLAGVEALRWLAEQLLSQGLDHEEVPPSWRPETVPDRDLASLAWVSENGNRSARRFQQAHRRPLFPSVG